MPNYTDEELSFGLGMLIAAILLLIMYLII